MLKIIHIITSLDAGGAQTMLCGLLSQTDGGRVEPSVWSLLPGGDVVGRITELGIPVHSTEMTRGSADPAAVLRLARVLRRERPDIVQTWLYHADLVGGVAARLAGIPVVWNIRHAAMNARLDRPQTIRVVKLLSHLSRWMSRRIITNSFAARDAHVDMGYRADRFVVIPNGFDTDLLRPDPGARREVRDELGIGDDTPVVGLFGRYVPHKDHRTFVSAAARLIARLPEVRFVLCGDGIDRENAELTGWIEDAGMRDCVFLLGVRTDVPRLAATLDVATSSSRSESFPMVIGESMACGVPCVVTDVGDSRRLVGDCGRVVPAGDPDALAASWQEMLCMSPGARRELGEAARRRIEDNYSLPVIAERYQSLYEEVLG